jgi:hypothetical protein
MGDCDVGDVIDFLKFQVVEEAGEISEVGTSCVFRE